jgi:hypothetical protein
MGNVTSPAIPRLELALEIYVHLSIICNDVALAQARQNLLAGDASNGRQFNILSNKLSNRKRVNRKPLTERWL